MGCTEEEEEEEVEKGVRCLGLGIVSMSRCPEMQVASCASCMCEVLPLLYCKREGESECESDRERERLVSRHGR